MSRYSPRRRFERRDFALHRLGAETENLGSAVESEGEIGHVGSENGDVRSRRGFGFWGGCRFKAGAKANQARAQERGVLEEIPAGTAHEILQAKNDVRKN